MKMGDEANVIKLVMNYCVHPYMPHFFHMESGYATRKQSTHSMFVEQVSASARSDHIVHVMKGTGCAMNVTFCITKGAF